MSAGSVKDIAEALKTNSSLERLHLHFDLVCCCISMWCLHAACVTHVCSIGRFERGLQWGQRHTSPRSYAIQFDFDGHQHSYKSFLLLTSKRSKKSDLCSRDAQQVTVTCTLVSCREFTERIELAMYEWIRMQQKFEINDETMFQHCCWLDVFAW